MRQTLQSAKELPPEWDILANDNYALKRTFLQTIQDLRYCPMEFHLFSDQGILDSIVVTFRIRMNLAQYSPLYYPVNATMIHIPVSIARPALVVGNKTRNEVESFITQIRGYVVQLNSSSSCSWANMAIGPMSPQLQLPIRWKSLDEYLNQLRSPYRRRYRLAQIKGQALEFRILESNKNFSLDHYDLYLHVNRKSRIRIETLPIEYFQSSIGKILECRFENKPVGFMQLIENDKELVWAFVGYNSSLNSELDIYHNMLLQTLHYAIRHDFQILEMGQTAEDAKLKLGAIPTSLWVMARHSLPFFNQCMHWTMPWLTYRKKIPRYHVFHKEVTP